MSKRLVKDTSIEGIQYCWNGHPMMAKKAEPIFNQQTGEVLGYSYELTCSKPFWRCICRHGIWRGYSKRKLV